MVAKLLAYLEAFYVMAFGDWPPTNSPFDDGITANVTETRSLNSNPAV